MRLHRFFVTEHLRNKSEITLYDEEIIHQLKDVFRLRAGNQLILLDNSGFEYLSEIAVIARGKLDIQILEASAAENMPERDIWLFCSLIKKDNFEWILEKGTELGASHFVPILSERSEKKDLNFERADKIVREAAEQSGRGTLPSLHNISELQNIYDLVTLPEKLIAFHLSGESFDRDALLNKKNELEKRLGIPKGRVSVGVFIGPEGGWTEREIQFFKDNKIEIRSLGTQVLRAETAAIAAASLLLL